MRRSPLWPLAGTFVLLALLPVVGFAREPGGAPAHTPLDDEPRLRALVSLAVRYRPLEEILASVHRETGVTLSARAGAPWPVGDMRATLFFDRRPAAEVLGMVARHLGLRWYRKGKGFELAVDPANDEAGRRRTDLEGQRAAIEGRMKELAALAGRPREQLEARQGEIDRRLAGDELSPEERAGLQEEKAAVADLLRPGGPVCARIYQRLTPAQRRELLATGDLFLSTNVGTLSAGDAARILQETLDYRHRTALPEALASAPRLETPTATHLRVRWTTERLSWLRPGRRGERRLTLAFETAFTSPNQSSTAPWSPALENAPVAPTATDDPVLLRRVELPLSLLKEVGGARPYTAGPARVVRTESLLTLGGFANVLHRVTGLQVVADSFIRARLDATKVATSAGHARPLVEVLDAAAADLDYAWRKEGDFLFFRSRTYYFDHPAEVLERTLRPWVRELTRDGPPPLEELAELEPLAALAAALTDEQCRGLDEFWDWYIEGSGIEDRSTGRTIDELRYDFRFWASLSAAQRQALLVERGHTLPVVRMDPRQQRAFLAGLTAPLADHGGLGPGGWVQAVKAGEPPRIDPQPGEVAGGAFRLVVFENRPKGTPARERNADGFVTYRPRYVIRFDYLLAGQELPARADQLPWG